MPNYQIEQSSLVYRWSFERMLPWLPGPGTPAFVTLCKGLHPYGLSPSEIALDASSARLSDVNLALYLLQSRLSIRITFGWVEFIVRDLLDEDVLPLVEIGEVIVSALGEIDEQVLKGVVQANYRAHLSIPSLKVEEFLHTYLKWDSNRPQLVPDGFAYKINLNGNALDNEETRLVGTKSLLFKDAVYVDLSLNRVSAGDPLGPGRGLAKDIERFLQLFDLKPQMDA